MRLRIGQVMALCLALGCPATVAAQTPSAPDAIKGNESVDCTKYENPAAELEELRKFYLHGDWGLLQVKARQILDKCTFVAPPNDSDLFLKGHLDYKRDYVTVVFGSTTLTNDPVVLRFLVHDPAPAPYANTLLGLPATGIDEKPKKGDHRFIQVFLYQNKGMTLTTSIQSKRAVDPLLGQIPDFVKAAVDVGVVLPLLQGTIAPLSMRTSGAPAKAPPSPLWATASLVPIIFGRSEMTFSDAIKTPIFIEAEREQALRAALYETRASVRAEEKYSNLTKELSNALLTTSVKYIDAHKATNCSQLAFEASCWKTFDEALDEAAVNFCLGLDKSNGGDPVECRTGEPTIVLAKYRAVIAPPKGPAVVGTTTMANTPKQAVTFGVVSAYIFGASSKRARVKVDGGKIVADPMGRALNVVAVNIHVPFDSSAPQMSAAERFHLFVGSAISPNFGAALGFGGSIVRNLSINVGYAMLAIPTIRPGDTLDSAPGTSTRPFNSSAAHVGFLGLGYKFGK